MENERVTDDSRGSTNPTSHDASIRNTDTFTGIIPRNRHRSNQGRSVLSLSQRISGQTNVRENVPTSIPNIRFRSLQHQNDNPVQSLPMSDNRVSPASCTSLSDNATTTNIGSEAASVNTRPRNRLQPVTRTAARNSSTSGTVSKGRSGNSPRRSNGRSNNVITNRSRGSHATRTRNDAEMAGSDTSSNPVRSLYMSRVRSDEDTIDLEQIHHQHRAGPSVNELNPPRHANVVGGLAGISGIGTADQPFELLNDSDTGEVEASATQSVMTDEEIARQLQQEEWERASTPVAVGFRTPSRLQFLQAVHGALGSDRPENIPRRRNMIRLPVLRNSRGAGPPRAALQLPDLLDILPPELMEIILGNGGQFLGEENDYEALLEMGEQIGSVSRGLSQADIDKIPVQKHKPFTYENGAVSSQASLPQCSICLSEFESGDAKRVLPCHHEIHKDCIDQWLKTNATCPVCRKDVREEREGRQ